MPPRLPFVTCLRATNPSASTFNLPLRSRPFSTTPVVEAHKKRVSHDPYIIAQRARKKAANLARRAELEEGRVASLGDPVRGTTTPFIESFDTGKPIEREEGTKAPKDKLWLNYALKPEKVEKQLEKSEQLAVELAWHKQREAARGGQTQGGYPWSQHLKYSSETSAVPPTAEEIEAQKQKDHERAKEAIARITALENGSSKDKMRVNIARCVQSFGRHNTDRIFPPRAPPLSNINSTDPHPVRPETNIAEVSKRIGPDTGSSEVQIAILTAKIKTLADFLQTRGKGDKHNKRNLRLLVHRRQKLLQYLHRKERGGPRWQHCIETLGLTEGTWRGEISL